MLSRRRQQTRDFSLALVGQVAAGRPMAAISGEERIDLTAFFLSANRFVFRVQGDSMVEAGILEGDMVVVEQTPNARDGDMVVALVDGEVATLKTFYNNNDGTITLVAANSAMPPFRFPATRVLIQGVVVGQMRSYR